MNQPTPICLVNGVLTDQLSVMDRGFAYGHGVFETIRIAQAQANLLGFHLDRLQLGATRLNISIDVHTVKCQLEYLLALASERQWRDGVVKIMVTAGGGGRGYAMPELCVATIVLQWHPLPQVQPDIAKHGIRLKLCAYHLPHNPELAGIKHLNRLDQVIARRELGAEFHEGLLLDCHRRVIEGVSSNVFIRIQDRLFTPKLDNCGVAGVMRRMVIEKLCPALGLSCTQQEILLDDLTQSDEIFICNSLCGIYPVIEVSPLASFAVGEWTRSLQMELARHLPCYSI